MADVTYPATHPAWCGHNPVDCYTCDEGTPDAATWHSLRLATLTLREWTFQDRTFHAVEAPWDEITDADDDTMPEDLAQLAADADRAAAWLRARTAAQAA